MFKVSTGLLAVVAGSAIVLAACGSGSNGAGGSSAATAGTPSDPRTVEISMASMKFDPPKVTVSEGETVRFVFANDDPLRHEAVVGDEAIQEEHEEEMASMGDMSMDDMNEHGDEEPPAVVVEPGESGELVVTFGEAGQTVIGCHEPGHWDAGMRVDVTIAA